MKDRKSIVPILFVILLVFPLVYQTLHLIHGHGYQQKYDAPPQWNSIVEVYDESEDCLICDFEYVVFLAGDQIESCKQLVYSMLDQPLINSIFSFLFQGFNNLLRAPPGVL